MKIVCISDTHGKWNKVTIPECDLLISAGDYSFRGEKHMVKDFHTWLSKQNARYVISVQGNHEKEVERNFLEMKQMVNEIDPAIHFIDEGSLEIEGIKIHCSAITPWFYDWAWNRRIDEIKKHWDIIPDDTQILITHGPPYMQQDRVFYVDGVTVKQRVGCMHLADRIKELKQLKLHVFGHIHCDAGESDFNGVKYINAAICDEQYMPTNPIRIFEF